MDDFNPYAAPKAPVASFPISMGDDEDRGVWRDGKTLVMVKAARLPHRCVKCNAPATFLLKRSLSWHSPWIYLGLFLNILIYIILALIFRKTAKILVPMCEEHRARRSKNILIAWIVSLSGIALFFAPAISNDLMFLIYVGVALLLFGLIFGSMTSQVVTVKKIDDTFIWLNKVSPVYLSSLPALPGTEGSFRMDKGFVGEL